MIDYEVLSTGSGGNAVIINKAVLVDCGVPYKAIEPYIRTLKLVLLTHIHGDHFRASTIRKIAMERPLVRFGICEWLAKPLVDAGVRVSQIDLMHTDVWYNYSLCHVSPVPLVHDVPNCGWKIHFPRWVAGEPGPQGVGQKLIYATDTNNLNGIVAKDYDLYMIEANYGDEEIRQRINDKEAAGQYVYEKRVLKTHLSQEKCNDWIYQNAGDHSEILYLHGHREESGDDDREAEGLDQGA